MSEGGALGVYLTDHMAGSVSASDLARRGATNNDGPLGIFFSGLARLRALAGASVMRSFGVFREGRRS